MSNDTAPLIEWVNHASFITTAGAVRLLCDPWFYGAAFNNGWELVAPTAFGDDDFSAITHIWISHQHPDHFAPGTLRKIDPATRSRIKVFYGKRTDKLVVSWLRSNGFQNVTELELERWIPLEPGVEIMCGLHDDDSWLAIRTAWGTLLNVNDCVLKRAPDIERIAELAGSVDVLFTQFSYAQWTGNPGDSEFRKRDAAEKLERIRLQNRILQPTYIVPFASYIYFCNAENFFLNDGMNDVGRVASFIESELGKRAVVLFPADRWVPGEPHDWQPAARRYAEHVARKLQLGPTRKPEPMPREEVESQLDGFLQRLRRKNPAVRALVRERTTFFLTDVRQAYELSVAGLERVAVDERSADIATASENLLYAIRTPWGGNTLHVSGRFTSYVPNGHLRFFALFRQLHHYNRTPIDGEWLLEQCRRVVRGVRRRLGRVMRGRPASSVRSG